MDEDKIIVKGDIPPPEVVENAIAQLEAEHKRNAILNIFYLLIGFLLYAIQLALICYKVLDVGVIGAAILGAVFGAIIGHLIARLFGEKFEHKDTKIGLSKLLELSKQFKEKNEQDVFEKNNKTEE